MFEKILPTNMAAVASIFAFEAVNLEDIGSMGLLSI
jgi:hypothetical protein